MYIHIHLLPRFKNTWNYIFTQKLSSLRVEETLYVVILSYNYRFTYSSKTYFKLNCIPLQDRQIKQEEDNWHTFHIIFFLVSSVLVKIILTAHMASNTLGLQSTYTNLVVFVRNMTERNFPFFCTSAYLRCLRSKLAYYKNIWKSKVSNFRGQSNIQYL
jgi:hypothetical protein